MTTIFTAAGRISIDDPPINDRMVDANGNISDVWSSWLTTTVDTLKIFLSASGVQTPSVTNDQKITPNMGQGGLYCYNIDTQMPMVTVNGVWKNVNFS